MDWNPELALLDTIQPRMFIVRCDCGPRRSDYALLLFFAYEIVILMNCGRLPFEIENVLGRFPVPRLFYFSLSASFFLRPAPFDENCVDWGGGDSTGFLVDFIGSQVRVCNISSSSSRRGNNDVATQALLLIA